MNRRISALMGLASLATLGFGGVAQGAVAEMPAPMTMEAPAMAGDIVDTAKSAGKFNTLLAAATAAGLVDALKGDGPITVFAPTDEAFAAVDAATPGGGAASRRQLCLRLLPDVVVVVVRVVRNGRNGRVVVRVGVRVVHVHRGDRRGDGAFAHLSANNILGRRV